MFCTDHTPSKGLGWSLPLMCVLHMGWRFMYTSLGLELHSKDFSNAEEHEVRIVMLCWCSC